MELDFTSQLHYFWALLPEIVLCTFGMVVLVAGVSGKYKDAERAPSGDPSFGPTGELGWLALLGVLGAGFANGWLYGVTEVGQESMIAVDRFRLYANWIFLLAAGLTILISFTYVYRQRLQAGEFYALVLFATAGAMVMAGTKTKAPSRRARPDRHIPRPRGHVDRGVCSDRLQP